jgi:hypothetical protein
VRLSLGEIRSQNEADPISPQVWLLDEITERDSWEPVETANMSIRHLWSQARTMEVLHSNHVRTL